MATWKKVWLYLVTAVAWMSAQYGIGEARALPVNENTESPDQIYLSQNKIVPAKDGVNALLTDEDMPGAQLCDHYSHRSHYSHSSHTSHYSSRY